MYTRYIQGVCTIWFFSFRTQFHRLLQLLILHNLQPHELALLRLEALEKVSKVLAHEWIVNCRKGSTLDLETGVQSVMNIHPVFYAPC